VEVWRERRPQRGTRRERVTRRMRRVWLERVLGGRAGEAGVGGATEEEEERKPRRWRTGKVMAPKAPLSGERIAMRTREEVGRFRVVLAKITAVLEMVE
jgi:hypothetical protein